jgi:23S rRNA (uridine2479-2'-O)-methyltransferase
MKHIRIYSENADFQLLEAIKDNRQKRKKRAEFLVEGVRNINAAVARGWPIKALLSAAENKLSNWASALVERGVADTHFTLPAALMAKLSDKTETSELLAVVAMAEDDLSRIPSGPSASFVVLDRPSNPGNLGTVIRSCDAFQIDGLVITGHGVDPYEPRVVRATTGSFFALPVVRLPSARELLPWVARLRGESAGLRVIGTSANASVSVREQAYEGRCLFIFGNETTGISAAHRELCDAVVRIPMAGTASSLNLSCAVSIVLHEHFSARTAGSPQVQAGSSLR